MVGVTESTTVRPVLAIVTLTENGCDWMTLALASATATDSVAGVELKSVRGSKASSHDLPE